MSGDNGREAVARCIISALRRRGPLPVVRLRQLCRVGRLAGVGFEPVLLALLETGAVIEYDGIVAFGGGPRPPPNAAEAPPTRNRRWTAAEDAVLHALPDADAAELARELGRTAPAVRRRRLRLRAGEFS